MSLLQAERLVSQLRQSLTARFWGVPPQRFHTTGRFRSDLQRALDEELSARRGEVDALVREVATSVVPGHREFMVQVAPYARVVPPACPEAVKDFHWDAYLGHPREQWGLWVPLHDIEGPEGLWLVDDALVEPFLTMGALTHAACEQMRAASRIVPMAQAEVLVIQSTTGHGGQVHADDVTRVSFDVRFARAGDEPRGPLGWRSRRLPA